MDQRALDIGLTQEEWRLVQGLCHRFSYSVVKFQGDRREFYQDLLQDLLLELYQTLGRYDIRNRRSFLYRVSVSVLAQLCRNHTRLWRRDEEAIWEWAESEEEFLKGDREVERMVAQSETRHLILSQLAGREYELIYRVFFLGETQREVARDWGVTEGAVSQRKARIFERLRRVHDEEEFSW